VNEESVRVVVSYLIRHPVAALPLLAVAWRFRRRGWWHHVPFLPVAPREYWSFRVSTASGDANATLSGEEILRAATWAAHQKVGR
jgi:hypothetical protein